MTDLDRYYNRLDKHQKAYYQSLLDKAASVVCVDSPAGTGKTTIAVMAGLQLLQQGEVDKIYYIRFADDRSLRLGFLPGDTVDKTSIYMTPFYDACLELGVDKFHVDAMITQEQIVLCTDIAMRGINISKSFVIIDESQNARFNDLKLVLTRIKDDCKVALIGHSLQCDNFKGKNEKAFLLYIDHLCKKNWAVRCELPINYRGRISSWADVLQPPEK